MTSRRLLATVLLCAPCACGAGSTGSLPPEVPRSCQAARPEVFGVGPFRNKSGHPMQVAGTEDLLIDTMVRSGCFTLVEREKLDVLISEIKLCDPDNPNAEYMSCETFATKGKLLGIKRMVLGDVLFFEPDVKGAALKAKFPSIGGLELGTSYAAIVSNFKVVEVETGSILATTVVHAVVPSDRAGISISQSGIDLQLMASSRTPMAHALHGMVHDGVRQLQGELKP